MNLKIKEKKKKEKNQKVGSNIRRPLFFCENFFLMSGAWINPETGLKVFRHIYKYVSAADQRIAHEREVSKLAFKNAALAYADFVGRSGSQIVDNVIDETGRVIDNARPLVEPPVEWLREKFEPFPDPSLLIGADPPRRDDSGWFLLSWFVQGSRFAPVGLEFAGVRLDHTRLREYGSLTPEMGLGREKGSLFRASFVVTLMPFS